MIDKDDSGSLAIDEICRAVDLKTGDKAVVDFLKNCAYRSVPWFLHAAKHTRLLP